MTEQLTLPFFDREGYEALKLKHRMFGRGKGGDYLDTRGPRSPILSHHQAGHPEFFRSKRFWVSAWKQLRLFEKGAWHKTQQNTPLSDERVSLVLMAGSLRPAKRIKEKVNVY